MINYIWIGLILISLVFAAINGKMAEITQAAIEYAKTGVDISIGLVGIMALWLGIMRVGEKAGLINLISKLIFPVLKKLFPGVPGDHPALGSVVMNLSANMLGLNNAATPLGLKAMEELQKLNKVKDRVTDAMVMFLALNTSSVQLIPASVIAILIAAGSTSPTDIIITALLATTASTLTAIVAVKVLGRFNRESQHD
ncbi:MAG: nucleoside recognition protein [Bacteroidetes bacterium]|nr:nucleoside recognition protein [Bacteroidota bacterium]